MRVGLIHGAWHTGQSWSLLQDSLAGHGIASDAVTLPSDEPGLDSGDYAEFATRTWSEIEEDLVLVAHSLGGLTAPAVAEMRPVSMIVYLAALLPAIGKSLAEQREGRPTMTQRWLTEYLPQQHREDNGNTWWSPELAEEIFYHDCPPQVARDAASQLRQQAAAPIIGRTPLEAMPQVPSAYIVCRDDRVVDPDWSRDAARERLGVETREIPGGHSPFLARPDRLAEEIIDIAGGFGLR